MLFDLAGIVSQDARSETFLSQSPLTCKGFVQSAAAGSHESFTCMHHCQEKNLFIFQLSSLKLLHMP